MSERKTVVLGVSGSIAAYKAVYLARLLMEDGDFDVWPVLTRSAARFVGPLTFSTLCGRRAVTDLWSSAEAGQIGHVELAHRADGIVIAPATADLLARLATGRADDPLTALVLSTRAPLLIAPAMESGMWNHPATREHVEVLRARGARILEPEAGALGSGREGVGRLVEPEILFEHVRALFSADDLADYRILVTAGPTREAIDPVRFLSNPSSGKMGYAIAEAAAHRGAAVTLVSGPSSLRFPAGVDGLRVESSHEMLQACRQNVALADVVIMAAAPADYTPEVAGEHKLKKADHPDGLQLRLQPTHDILQELRTINPRALAVGFAAETRNLLDNARGKLERKQLDLIVANDISRPDAGFGVDTNAVTLIDRSGDVEDVEPMPKRRLADLILDRIAAMPMR